MLNKAKYPRLNPPMWQQVPGVRLLGHLNWDGWLFVLIAISLALSFGLIYSASGQKSAILMRHTLHVGISFIAFIVMAQISPRTIKQWAPFLYGIGLLLLLAVFVVGTASKGAQRWVNLGGIRFQPSEFMKFVSPLMLAYYLSNKPLPVDRMHLVVSLIIIFVPGLLIAKQPDLGTGLLVIGTGFGVLFFAGIRWRLIFKMVGLGLAGLPLLWFCLHDYQRQRVMTFLNPESDPLGAGYHIIQSKIAIGSGGLYGKGWCLGSQVQLNFFFFHHRFYF